MLDAGIKPLNSDARFALYLDLYVSGKRRVDSSNILKSIEDGLNPRKPRGRTRGLGLFWKDDEQVDITVMQKMKSTKAGIEPCAVVVVRML